MFSASLSCSVLFPLVEAPPWSFAPLMPAVQIRPSFGVRRNTADHDLFFGVTFEIFSPSAINFNSPKCFHFFFARARDGAHAQV